MRRNLIIIGLVLFILIPIMLMLSSYMNKKVTNKVDFKGKVTNLSRQGDVTYILVEGDLSNKYNNTSVGVNFNLDNTLANDKASVKIDKETVILRNLQSKKLTIDAINIGKTVEVTFTGPVLESFPVQATAKMINILD